MEMEDWRNWAVEETEEEAEDHMNRINTDLFVGDIFAANNANLLRKYHITHIVAAAKFVEPAFPEEFEYHLIEIYDAEDENIQQHFLQAITFIEIAIRMGGRVLVHCMAGMSRSVSVCIAYLMVKQRLPFDQAFALVKAVRPIADPNPGFRQQLKLFQERAHKFDLNAHVLDAIIDKPEPEPPANIWYRCRKCRHKLLNDHHVIPHSVPEEQNDFYRKRVYGKKNNKAATGCSSWFVQEAEWMGDLSELEGTLECPRCKAKVGSWAWAGGQCSCGEWVTPFFQLLKSRVDEVPVASQPPAVIILPQAPTQAPAPAPAPAQAEAPTPTTATEPTPTPTPEPSTTQ